MQRATYAQSPPLHHPVPQHVSTVPQLRSPPPPPGSAQSQQGYAANAGGNPYQQQGGTSGNVFGQYGNFMNDPTAQVAAQFGQTAFKHGQEYMEQNVSSISNTVVFVAPGTNCRDSLADTSMSLPSSITLMSPTHTSSINSSSSFSPGGTSLGLASRLLGRMDKRAGIYPHEKTSTVPICIFQVRHARLETARFGRVG